MRVIEPYEHDCSECKWVGWMVVGDKLGNMYVCLKDTVTEIIVRWSSVPDDYSCYTFFHNFDKKPHSIQIFEKGEAPEV